MTQATWRVGAVETVAACLHVPASTALVSAALSSPLRRPHPPSRPPEMCPLKIHKYRCRAAAEAWTFGRGLWAIQSAIGRLLKPSGSKNMTGRISATGGLQSSPGLSRAAGQIGKSDFFCSLFRPRARFGTRLGREGVVMPVLSASEGAQRRPNAQKRRGVRALFCEPNG